MTEPRSLGGGGAGDEAGGGRIIPLYVKILAFRPEHPKEVRTLQVRTLSETKSIP